MYFVTGYDQNNKVIFFTDYADKDLAEKRCESIERVDGCHATCEYKKEPTREDYKLWNELWKTTLSNEIRQ